jgi:hypothetical protein
MSLHGAMITEIEEIVQTRTGITTTTTIATIANDGGQTILVMAAAVSTTTMEIGAETTAEDNDRIPEIQAVILVIVRRNQATHCHRHHPRPPHRQTDIHEGHTTAGNPPPPTLGVGLSVVPYVMSDGLRDSDPEQ